MELTQVQAREFIDKITNTDNAEDIVEAYKNIGQDVSLQLAEALKGFFKRVNDNNLTKEDENFLRKLVEELKQEGFKLESELTDEELEAVSGGGFFKSLLKGLYYSTYLPRLPFMFATLGLSEFLFAPLDKAVKEW